MGERTMVDFFNVVIYQLPILEFLKGNYTPAQLQEEYKQVVPEKQEERQQAQQHACAAGPGKGNKQIHKVGRVQVRDVFDLHRKDEEQQDLKFRVQAGKGQEQAEVQELLSSWYPLSSHTCWLQGCR